MLLLLLFSLVYILTRFSFFAGGVAAGVRQANVWFFLCLLFFPLRLDGITGPQKGSSAALGTHCLYGYGYMNKSSIEKGPWIARLSSSNLAPAIYQTTRYKSSRFSLPHLLMPTHAGRPIRLNAGVLVLLDCQTTQIDYTLPSLDDLGIHRNNDPSLHP